MINTEQIIAKLQAGLQALHQTTQMPLNEMSIKISIHKKFPIDGIHAKVMRADNEYGDADINALFGISPLEAIAVRPALAGALKKYALKDNINEAFVSARIYPSNNNYAPAVNIYSANSKVRETNVHELTNMF